MHPLSRRFCRALGFLLPGVWLLAAMAPRARADELTRQVQEELRKRNLYFGDVNGLGSPQVAAALRRYQERKGFQATGAPDDLTLRSLGLDAPPARIAVAATTPPLPTDSEGHTAATRTTTLPPASEAKTLWPDMPVIHSDQARESPLAPGEAEAAAVDEATPPPKPPPAATSESGPAITEVRDFVENFLRQGESNDPRAQLSFFDNQVHYFNEGTVGHDFIARDTERYNKRWPIRRFALAGPLHLAVVPGSSPEKLVVNFRCRFEVKQDKNEAKDPKDVKGEADETYTLARPGGAGLHIVGIQDERVRYR